MELWIIRHGQTVANIKRVMQGHQGGELTEQGVQQAKLAGKRLGKEKFSEIFCSDLDRTKMTLENILESFENKDIKINYTHLLREKGGGVLEGQPLTAFRINAEKAKMPIRKYRPEKGESWEDVNSRANEFIDLLLSKYIPQYEKSKKVNQIKGKEGKGTNQKIGELIPKKQTLVIDLLEKKSAKSNIDSKIKDSKQDKEESKIEEKKIDIKDVNNKSVTINETTLPKILVVTHGGYIMEFINAFKLRAFGQMPSFNNDSLNCSLNFFRITPKLTLKGDVDIAYEIVKTNDVSHLDS